MINGLALVFAALLVVNGSYFLRHQKRPFLLFHPERYPALQRLLRISGSGLLLIALVTVIAVCLDNQILLVIALIAGCGGCLIPEFCLIPFMNR
ncbi:hypothetical protein M8332_02490 [Fructilactobacillus ixorae]|uniref:DUF3784 domain-containing protein n=1 Tax=Fructilactobacillus ixorae TaxID=1750535 RepID=A0ABY5C8V4_9LACO|nr:hypothetical protein [Fructilactobacillus ixorae]USS93736.1 hypothetical protein M8332_02490 [Fructilactobacillus ixorae]